MEEIKLETERLVLKVLTPARIHELFNTLEKEDIMDFLGCDEEVYERFLVMHEGGMETHRFTSLLFLITDKETGRPIGECGYHTINKKHRRAEIFYILRNDEVKRKGYMTEALPAVLDYGFNEIGLHRVKALVADWNEPSLKLLARFGFSFEGTMREDYYENGENGDSDCYSLLRWEWLKDEKR